MPSSKPTPASLQQVLIGRRVELFEVYGINSLKTTSPPLSNVAGTTIKSVELSDDRRILSIATSTATITINLERVGYWSLEPGMKGWAVGDGPAPTARLVLDGSEVLNFAEPNKTKRITVRLQET
jgi:hypothetical protein